MTPAQAQHLQNAAIARMEIIVWTVYKHPSVHPRDFVLRPFLRGEPLIECAVAPSLGALSAYIPVGLTRCPRFADDDPVIVETWM